MFFDPIDIPDEVLEAQEQGRLVIFAGAGVSMGDPSNLPSFVELAEYIAGSHPLAATFSSRETRLDRFLGELSRSKVDVQSLCRAKISDSKSRPTELHRSLVDLFSKPEHVRIVTTNFDNHFRVALGERGWKTDCYYAPALPLGHQFSGLVYLHGWIERPEPLVLTDEEFGRAYLTEGWAREFLQRLFAEFTTLFVGYSHNDIPVEYLARGMSGKSIAPSFALTAAGEAHQWGSLGIREVTFEKTQDPNPFKNLYAGVKKWSEFSRQQPTDIAERIKAIVCAPENLAPDKSQSSLLRRCLEREDSCHFFTREAKGWHWVKWLHEQGLLPDLFDRSRRELAKPQADLTFWLAGALLAEESDEGLLLVEKHHGLIGRHLWSALCRGLWLNESVKWSSPLIHKWVLVLAETCPPDSMGELSHLLRIVAKAAPHTLGMVLLRRLTDLRIVVSKGFDFASLLKGGDTVESKDKAEFEVAVAGEVHELDRVWEDCFKPRLPELRESLLLLLENRLREAHELYRAAERSDATHDPCCHRGRIYERDAYRTGRGLNLVLDLFLDVLEESAKQGWSLSEPRLAGWLASEVPVLVRVGLYRLHLSDGIPKARKVELVRQHQLVHPAVFGATHESWLVLSDCYTALDAAAKQALWQAINQGPSEKRPDDVAQEAWQEWRQRQIDRLTWFLATKNKECSEAALALAALKQREPNFRGHEGMDQVFFGGGQVTEGPRTPKSATDLLSASPGSQIEWLLSYQGGKAPFEESREGLLHAVGAACAQNHAWGVSLLEELGTRQAWKSDLWDAAFWRMNLSALPQDKLTWLLKSLDSHFADSPSLQGLTVFLFHGVDFSDGKRPSAENQDLLIRVSLLIWKQIKGTEARVTKDFKKEEWANRAINHPAGRIAEFWLKCCDLQRRESGGQIPGFPDWLNEPLADMVAGADFAGQLGRVTLALHFPFVYHVDPAWAAAELFPKFRFTVVGEEAFLMWEPHAGYGDLSRELILLMPPIYREAFQHFHDVDGRLQTGFFRHIAGMVYSCLFDVNADNWFRDFLTGLTDDEKANWARQVEWGLRGASEARRAQIWQRWMKTYWEDRLHGRPCPLLPKEAEEMLEWAFLVGAAFPEAVEFVVRGPRIQQRLGIVLHILEKHESPEQYPEAVLRLLDWLLEDPGSHWMVSKDIEAALLRLPKKRAFLPLLNSICQHLASVGYPGAADLKHRIEQAFSET
jgi:hypothetical protein